MGVIPYLSDSDHYGNKVKNTVLEAAKIGAMPSSPEAGHFYMKSGILYYRTAANAELPVHENAFTSIVSGGVGSLSVQMDPDNREATISISEADSDLSGLLSTELYDLLDGATASAANSMLVIRDNSGGAAFSSVAADEISGLSSNQDAQTGDYGVSLGYFRNAIASLQASLASRDFKENVRVAMTIDISLSDTPGTYDGVSIGENDSIVLIGQTNPAENGAYLVTGGGLVRRTDSENATVMTSGATYPVTEGTLGGRLVMLVTPPGFTVGSDALTFMVIDDSVLAGDGLVKTGKTVHVVGTTDRVSVNADSVDIASTYAGQASITTVGTVASGAWGATEIAIARGGTGATTAPAALTNLGAVQEEAAILLGDGSATSFTVTSALNNPAPDVEGFFLVSGEWIKVPDLDARVNATTYAITVYAQQGSTPIPTNSLKIVVSGKKF